MMNQTQKSLGDWVDAPLIDTKVNVKSGALIRISTGKALPVFRNTVNGSMVVVLPYNRGQDGIGKGRAHQLGRVILAVLQEGSPFKSPRQGFAVPKDGNKWNIQPSNLKWIGRAEFIQERIMAGDFPLKLNGYAVLTMKDVVTQLAKKDISDYDAIGSTFGVSGATVASVMANRSWAYVNKYIKGVTSKATDYKINRAIEAVAAYTDYDNELDTYLKGYETVG
jgi:hypothetical protein